MGAKVSGLPFGLFLVVAFILRRLVLAVALILSWVVLAVAPILIRLVLAFAFVLCRLVLLVALIFSWLVLSVVLVLNWLLAGATLINLGLEEVLSYVLGITGMHDGKVIGKAGDVACADLEGLGYLQLVTGELDVQPH